MKQKSTVSDSGLQSQRHNEPTKKVLNFSSRIQKRRTAISSTDDLIGAKHILPDNLAKEVGIQGLWKQ